MPSPTGPARAGCTWSPRSSTATRPKTKAALATLNAVTQAKRVLVVLDRDDVLNWVSLRNVPQVHLIEAGQLNTYDVLVADEVVFTETALAEYVAGPAKGKALGRAARPRHPRDPGRRPVDRPAEGEGTVETTTGCRGAGEEGRREEGSGRKKAAGRGRPRRRRPPPRRRPPRRPPPTPARGRCR